jgi:hypothetical protein
MAARVLSMRLVFASVVLPAVVVVADEAVLALAIKHRWSVSSVLAVFAWFVVQTGLLSYVAGCWLSNWGWRLVVLCWSMLLVNLWLAHAASVGRYENELLSLAFSSGQIGALAAWTFLGACVWQRRLALLSAAFIPVFVNGRAGQIMLWGDPGDPWRSIVLIQAAGTCILAMWLFVSGHRIELADSRASTGGAGPIQFSIRHLLLATTFVAVMVPTLQGMARAAAKTMNERQWLHTTADGVLLAVVSLAAIWAALGMGHLWIKVLAFASLAVVAGATLYWLERTVLYPARWSPNWTQPLTGAGWWWVAWTSLEGSLLAGMLLVLRANGYRLVRRRR